MASKKAPAPQWTEAKQKQALAGHYYIKIGDKRGHLRLTGAVKMWQKEPRFVYVPDLRVAGTPGDIEVAFEAMGYPASDIRARIARGYTAASAGTAAFESEVEAAKAATKREKVVVAEADISAYAKMVEEAKPEGRARGRSKSPRKARSPKSKSKSPRKAKSKSPRKARKTSPKNKREAKSLAVKLGDLHEGKVMDVSKLLKDGHGAKTIGAPAGDRSKKVMVPGYRMVSDNLRGVKNASHLLGDAALVDAWEAARKQHGVAKKASPKRSPRKSAKASKPMPLSGPTTPIGTGPEKLPPLPVSKASPGRVRVPSARSPRSPRF